MNEHDAAKTHRIQTFRQSPVWRYDIRPRLLQILKSSEHALLSPHVAIRRRVAFGTGECPDDPDPILRALRLVSLAFMNHIERIIENESAPVTSGVEEHDPERWERSMLRARYGNRSPYTSANPTDDLDNPEE